MGLHSSLRIDTAGAQQRTVMSRIERIKELMKKGSWSDTHPVTGLPKTKIVRIKAKKKVKEEAAAVPGAAPAAAGAAAPAAGAKAPAAAAKAPAAKPAADAKKK